MKVALRIAHGHAAMYLALLLAACPPGSSGPNCATCAAGWAKEITQSYDNLTCVLCAPGYIDAMGGGLRTSRAECSSGRQLLQSVLSSQPGCWQQHLCSGVATADHSRT